MLELKHKNENWKLDKKHYFPGQREGEKIEILIHKHWIIGVFLFIKYLIYIVIPLILRFALRHYSPELFDNLVFGIADICGVIFILYMVLLWYIGWLNAYLDVVIITNERLIDVDQESLFSRKISEGNLLKVQDVTSGIHGILGTIFSFGYITMETAGEHGGQLFRIFPVANPDDQARKILDIVDKLTEKHKEHVEFKETHEGNV